MSGAKKTLVIGGGRKGRRRGKKKGKKKHSGVSEQERAELQRANFEMLMVRQKLGLVRARLAELRSANDNMALEAEVNASKHDGSFDALLAATKARDMAQADEIRTLLHDIATQRQANVRLDDELTATMKHKIEDTQTRTRVYNDLKSHHKGRMEFLRTNAHLQDSVKLATARIDTCREQVAALRSQIREFDATHPNLVVGTGQESLGSSPAHRTAGSNDGAQPPVRVLNPPGLARVLLLVTWRNIHNGRFLLDCYRALDDLLSPEFKSSEELASDLGRQLIKQTLLQHPDDPILIATTCRALRKLVSLQPEAIEHFVKVGTMARIAEHMDRHWWSAAVQEAGTDALIALLPRHLFAACNSSSTGAALANVLRGTYGKLSGAHVAVGVLRVAVKAARAPKSRGGPHHAERLAAWKHRPSETFDPAHSDSDDDDNMYLLRQRLIGYTRQLKRTLRDTEDGLGAQSRHVARAKNTPRDLYLQALFATVLLLLEDRNPHLGGVDAKRTDPAHDTAGARVASRATSGGATHASPTRAVSAASAVGHASTQPEHASPLAPSNHGGSWAVSGLTSVEEPQPLQLSALAGSAAPGADNPATPTQALAADGPRMGAGAIMSSLLAARRASAQLKKARQHEVGEVTSATTGLRIQQAVQASAAIMRRLLKYIVTDEASLDAVSNYRCLTIVVLLLKNQHHVPAMADVAEVACRFLAYMLTKQAFSRRLLRRMDILTAVVRTTYLHATNHEVITAAAPIIEYFGGNHSACVKLLAVEMEQNNAHAAEFARMSHTQRVMHLNAALEEPDVGELPARDAVAAHDTLHLRPDRPLSRPAGNNLDFKRMFSKGLMVLRAEHVLGGDLPPASPAGRPLRTTDESLATVGSPPTADLDSVDAQSDAAETASGDREGPQPDATRATSVDASGLPTASHAASAQGASGGSLRKPASTQHMSRGARVAIVHAEDTDGDGSSDSSFGDGGAHAPTLAGGRQDHEGLQLSYESDSSADSDEDATSLYSGSGDGVDA